MALPTPAGANTAYAEDVGCVADGGAGVPGFDNAPPLNEALAAGLTVLLGGPKAAGVGYNVSSPVVMAGKVGSGLVGPWLGRRGPVDANHGSWLFWQGSKGGVALEVYSMNCLLQGFGIGACVGTSLNRAIDLDLPAALNIPYVINSENWFDRVSVHGNWGPVADGVCVGGSLPAAQNLEFQRWQGMRFYQLTNGVHVPSGTGQARGLVVDDCDFIQCGTGLSAAIASVSIYDSNFTGCRLGAATAGSYGAWLFQGCDTEGCVRFCHLPGTVATFIANRLTPSAAPPNPALWQEWMVLGNRGTFVGNYVDPSGPGGQNLRIRTNGGVIACPSQDWPYDPFPRDGLAGYVLDTGPARVGSELRPGGVYYDQYGLNTGQIPQQAMRGLTYGVGTGWENDPARQAATTWDGTRFRLAMPGGYAAELATLRRKGDTAGANCTWAAAPAGQPGVPPSPAPLWNAWAVTYVGPWGESEPDLFARQFNSPAAVPAALWRLGVPFGPAGTAARRVYRGSDYTRLDTFRLVGALPDNASQTFADAAPAGTSPPPPSGSPLPAAWVNAGA